MLTPTLACPSAEEQVESNVSYKMLEIEAHQVMLQFRVETPGYCGVGMVRAVYSDGLSLLKHMRVGVTP